ncbi:MAG: hypothetical protein U1F67_01025 [Rubrivivax sp.]
MSLKYGQPKALWRWPLSASADDPLDPTGLGYVHADRETSTRNDADLDVVASWITTPATVKRGPGRCWSSRWIVRRSPGIGFSSSTSFCPTIVRYSPSVNCWTRAARHLARIIVTPDRRRAGYGSRLVSGLLARAAHRDSALSV